MKTKSFDCVEMKRRIQQTLAEEETRLGREEVRLQGEAWRESSAAPLARWWRGLAPEQVARVSAVLGEDPPKL